MTQRQPVNRNGGMSWEDNGAKVRALPQHLIDKTVVDIGGFDGAYAAECLWRGASIAVVADNRQYLDYELDGRLAWPEPVLPPGVQGVDMDLFAWTEPMDLVICYNVLYHVPNPKEAIHHLRRITKGWLCLSTSFLDGSGDWYAIDERLARKQEGFDAPKKVTVFFKPTVAGLFKTLRDEGFDQVKSAEVYGGDHIVVRAM